MCGGRCGEVQRFAVGRPGPRQLADSTTRRLVAVPLACRVIYVCVVSYRCYISDHATLGEAISFRASFPPSISPPLFWEVQGRLKPHVLVAEAFGWEGNGLEESKEDRHEKGKRGFGARDRRENHLGVELFW